MLCVCVFVKIRKKSSKKFLRMDEFLLKFWVWNQLVFGFSTPLISSALKSTVTRCQSGRKKLVLGFVSASVCPEFGLNKVFLCFVSLV